MPTYLFLQKCWNRIIQCVLGSDKTNCFEIIFRSRVEKSSRDYINAYPSFPPMQLKIIDSMINYLVISSRISFYLLMFYWCYWINKFTKQTKFDADSCKSLRNLTDLVKKFLINKSLHFLPHSTTCVFQSLPQPYQQANGTTRARRVQESFIVI